MLDSRFPSLFATVFATVMATGLTLTAWADQSSYESAFAYCRKGLTTDSAFRMSLEERAQLDMCLKSKGIQVPDRPKPLSQNFSDMEECLKKTGVELPKPDSTERPIFNKSTRAAFEACRPKQSTIDVPDSTVEHVTKPSRSLNQ